MTGHPERSASEVEGKAGVGCFLAAGYRLDDPR